MKNMIYAYKGKRITFDDWVKDQEGIWTQICTNCLVKYNGTLDVKATKFPGDGEVCGVKGCNGEADYYLDFEENKVTFEED